LKFFLIYYRWSRQEQKNDLGKAICNMSPVNSNEWFGSGYLMKYRTIFDFEATLKIKFSNEKTLGLLFNYKDMFNYYLLEISTKNYMFKMVKDGYTSVLSMAEVEKKFF
jgi:hypothetical protein